MPQTDSSPQDQDALVAREEFAALLESYFSTRSLREGRIATGRIVKIENDYALIDVGLKSEGRVSLRELARLREEGEFEAGEEVEVFVDRVENALGEAVLSCEKARREKTWEEIQEKFAAQEKVEGEIVGPVKGGYHVDIGGLRAFLPGSQIDIRPVRSITPLLGQRQLFRILNMDRRDSNIVVSRRSVLEEDREQTRGKMLETLHEGQVMEGVVKNITNYGAFVDLGGVDGLLHVTHMSWRRVQNPHDVLAVGDTLKVKILRINPETHRINLSIKDLEADPWEKVVETYPEQSKWKGRVTNITDYGAFVELEPGIEGLVHVSEMSWLRKALRPAKLVSVSQEVEVMVLGIDTERRRISLGMKQCTDNPWEALAQSHPPGTQISGEVTAVTEFGVFINMLEGIDGMVHMSDLSWESNGEEALKKYQKGDKVEAQILEINVEKERAALGIKQISRAAVEDLKGFKQGEVITCTVAEVKANGIDVHAGSPEGPMVFIRRGDLARDRADQRPDRFAAGEKVDARITSLNIETGRIVLSIKARELAEEREAVKQYGSAESGASLGDILSPALKQARPDEAGEPATPADAEEKPAKKTKAAAKTAKAKTKDEAAQTEAKPAAAKTAAKKSASKTAAKTKSASKTAAKTKSAAKGAKDKADG